MTDVFADLRLAEEKMFQDQLDLPGWSYRDLPQMTVELFERFIELAGEDNLRWLTVAERVWEGNTTKRGQVMISPKGMQNIRDHNEATIQ